MKKKIRDLKMENLKSIIEEGRNGCKMGVKCNHCKYFLKEEMNKQGCNELCLIDKLDCFLNIKIEV